MRGCPNFSFWVPVALAKIYSFPIAITFAKIFISLASPNKKTTHTHKIIRQGDHYSLVNTGSHVK